LNNLIFFVLLFGQGFLNAQLIELTSLPEPITNNAVSEGFINGNTYIYSFGGLDSTKLYSGIHLRNYRMNVELGNWERITDLPDTLGKIAMAASRIDDIIYIVGGYHVSKDGHELSSNKVHRFKISENKFLMDAAPIPLPIDDHVQAVWNDSLIYVITGWSDKQNEPNVQVYNPNTDEWSNGTPVPDNNSFKSFGASGVIVENTIYYFGGAEYEKYYPVQNQLRVGVINPENPLEINWDMMIPDSTIYGYRMAATIIGEDLLWIGGSSETYNYDAIQYETKDGVEPEERVLKFDRQKNKFEILNYILLPMDLRGIAKISPTKRIVIGGIGRNQKVSNKVLLLEINE